MAEECRCSTKHCRGIPSIKHLGKWLCEKCWGALCDKDHEAHLIPNGPILRRGLP